MTQTERRIYLIRALQDEMPEYAGLLIPSDETAQKRLLRALFNVRPPLPAESGFLRIQDAYLAAEVAARGIVDGDALPAVGNNSRIALWQGDITRLRVDAIVNAANSGMRGCFRPCHNCIDNMVHTLAGIQLRLTCDKIMRAQGHEEPVGTAKITPGYNLPCRHILHTVGPMIEGPLRMSDCALLAQCYRACLALAVQNNVQSIAFCCISTGVFCFPPDRAAEIAVHTVSRFLDENDTIQRVIFDVFTDADHARYKTLLQ